MMTGDETQLATFNIKIGFTEDELINTTGFEIKKLEDFDVNNIQSSNEIWCTIPSYSKLESDAKARCTYNAKNRCWILQFDRELTQINNWDRSYYSSLTSITIPNSVTTIEWGAFQYCTNLTSITIPNSVSSIGNGAFAGCTGLTSITIPNSVTSISDRAFAGCTGLTSITIPNSVNWIGWDAFLDTSQECIMYVPIGRAEYYKNLLSRSGFKGNVVEISETDSLSQ